MTENDTAKSQGNKSSADSVIRPQRSSTSVELNKNVQHSTDLMNIYIFKYLHIKIVAYLIIKFLQINVGFPIHYMHVITSGK